MIPRFTHKLHRLDEYDKKQLEEARDLILNIYYYHAGDSHMKSETKRLETILSKIDFLLNQIQ